jgi:hypothetical protein
VTPLGGFNGNVALSCSGLPAFATCSFSSQNLSEANGAVTTTLTIATGSATASLHSHDDDLFALANLRILGSRVLAGARTSLGLTSPAIGLIGLVVLGRRPRRKLMVGLLICIALLAMAQVGCNSAAGKQSGPGLTPAGQYTVTVNGTTTTFQRSATVSVTVH